MRPGLRFEIFKRDQFTCRYCGKKSPEAVLEVDHVVPESAGGTDDGDNLVTACYECNRGKAARLLTDVPLEPSLHEKTIAIAEHELQLAEYNHWRAKQREREEKDLDGLEAFWFAHFESGGYGRTWWKRADARRFLRKLGFPELQDILEIVAEKTERQDDHGWP